MGTPVDHNRKWRHANPEKIAAYSRLFREKYPDRAKSHKIKHKYGITLEELNAMRERQEGKCAICLREEPNLHIDHCHDTGKIRGLLCRGCNLGIGSFGDDPERLARAATYLSATTAD